jgi:hypothetical protein
MLRISNLNSAPKRSTLDVCTFSLLFDCRGTEMEDPRTPTDNLNKDFINVYRSEDEDWYKALKCR